MNYSQKTPSLVKTIMGVTFDATRHPSAKSPTIDFRPEANMKYDS